MEYESSVDFVALPRETGKRSESVTIKYGDENGSDLIERARHHALYLLECWKDSGVHSVIFSSDDLVDEHTATVDEL